MYISVIIVFADAEIYTLINDMFYARMSRPYARDLSETAQYKSGSLEET